MLRHSGGEARDALRSRSRSDRQEVKEARAEARRRYIVHVRHSTAVGLLWAVFTCGFVVINVIVFVQPQWLVRLNSSGGGVPGRIGYFGLWQWCNQSGDGINSRTAPNCSGWFGNFETISNDYFKASTFFVGVSCLVVFICVALFLLFLVPGVSHKALYCTCGSLQLVCGIFMFLGCVIYPGGWSDPNILYFCADSRGYVMGLCRIGWAYILAMVGIFDALLLAVLAFVIAFRQAEWPTSGETTSNQQANRQRLWLDAASSRGSTAEELEADSGGTTSRSQPIYVVPARRRTTYQKRPSRDNFVL